MQIKGKVTSVERLVDVASEKESNYVLIKVRATPSHRLDQIMKACGDLKKLIGKDVLVMIE